VEQLADLGTYLRALQPVDLVDILLVAAFFYAALWLVRGTRAVQLIRGVLVLSLAFFLLSSFASLRGFHWLLEIMLPALLVAVPVIFQPELRRALEQVGRAGLIISREPEEMGTVRSVVAVAARRLSEQRVGGLIVLEHNTALGDLVERGVRLDAEPSVELLVQIFVRNSPLHDGAVIIRGDRIAAAGVVLPIGELYGAGLPPGLGTRHLAALSLTETTDAEAVVVSEETGRIALARNGRLLTDLDEGALSRELYEPHRMRHGPAEWIRPLRDAGAAIPTWRHRGRPAAASTGRDGADERPVAERTES
jgi:diadenylate cyclase